MLPVSGAEQLNTIGATRLRPIVSQSMPYSQLVSPAPCSSSGMNRFHSPSAFARSRSSTRIAGYGTPGATSSSSARSASSSTGYRCSSRKPSIRPRSSSTRGDGEKSITREATSARDVEQGPRDQRGEASAGDDRRGDARDVAAAGRHRRVCERRREVGLGQQLSRHGDARLGDEQVARAGGEEVRYVEAGGPPRHARHALLEQHVLDQLGLRLVARGGCAYEWASRELGTYLPCARPRLGQRQFLAPTLTC